MIRETEWAPKEAKGLKGALGRWLGQRTGARAERKPLRKLLYGDLTVLEPPPDVTQEPAPGTFCSTELPAVKVDPVLVEIIFGSTRREEAPKIAPRFAIPCGAHDYSALSRVLANDELFTGLVVHISINEVPAQDPLADLLPRFLTSLLREADYGFYIGGDEFLIISPELKGAEAHQRLERISHQLRSFQLGMAGSPSVLFSWGAVEPVGERLLDAVTNATEKMLQTKHHRKSVSSDAIV